MRMGSSCSDGDAGLAPEPPASPLTDGTPAPGVTGAGRGEEELRTCGGRPETAGNSALRAGGRSGATVDADVVTGAVCGCGGLDRNAGQLWKRYARGR